MGINDDGFINERIRMRLNWKQRTSIVVILTTRREKSHSNLKPQFSDARGTKINISVMDEMYRGRGLK